MASALRFAARKICSRPPQPRVWAAASAAVKEEQRTLLPRISHGGSSLRRFISSETPNLLHNDKHLRCDAKSGLDKRIAVKKHELLELLRLKEGEYSTGNEQKELLQLLRRSDKRVIELVEALGKVMAGSMLAAAVTVVVGYQFFFSV